MRTHTGLDKFSKLGGQAVNYWRKFDQISVDGSFILYIKKKDIVTNVATMTYCITEKMETDTNPTDSSSVTLLIQQIISICKKYSRCGIQVLLGILALQYIHTV